MSRRKPEVAYFAFIFFVGMRDNPCLTLKCGPEFGSENQLFPSVSFNVTFEISRSRIFNALAF